MKDKSVKELKLEMELAHEKAEVSAHEYFVACEVGPERTRAGEIYNNIRISIRVPL